MDLVGWLRSLGLGQYEAAFRDNAIDEKVLPRLTAEDLKDLGVGLVGHRRMLLDAIAALRGDANAKEPVSEALPHAPASAEASAPPLTVAPAAEAVGERRYLTVMFCDLVGSTGISAQLDAEEWRDLVGAYLDAASAAVAEMGGHVAKKLGDGLMALFGYPVAHENDAERAARAALAIQRALAELNRKNAGTGKPALAARIGIETGAVVVDTTGEIFGDAPNIAARVQALAEPGAVLVTARVQRQVAGLFVAEERGSHALKGVPEPVALFRLVRASGGGRRSGARNLTALIGRDDETAMLMRRWERARQGDGQLVLIVGEPGLGKSRLIEEFHARLGEVPHTWVEWSCSQLLQNTPLHPIAEWGRQRFGGADVPAERRLAELESSLAQVKLDPAENTPLLAPLLDIPLLQDRAPALAPEELRRRQLAALTNWVMAGAKVQPVVLAFEDLHWADPTTLDVLRGIAERGALAPLFIVATTRPEFRPPWSMRSHHGTISLAPLDRLQVREMVVELSARHALPRDVVEDVAARTGGVPLFVEEVTRLLLERGEQGGIQTIPPTLQQSLMARLDRLGPAREVAQVGSVIGRGFSYGLLRDVAGMKDAAVQAALDRLAEADIVLVQGAPPASDYRFKHALIQDAAYENLLKSRRQVLHRRVAEILRDRFADTAAAEPEALAYHFTQAGLTDAAIEWWGKAGDQALRRSAFQEAIAHLGKAIEMADSLDKSTSSGTTDLAGQRFKLQTNYGLAVAWSRGFAAEETRAAFSRAQELSPGADNSDERFTTLYGQWVNSIIGGELGLARTIAETFLREAENGSRMPETMAALRYLGLVLLSQGHLVEARTHLEEVLRTYDPGRDRQAQFRFGTDSLASATIYLANACWQLGDFRRARELSDEAIARAVDSAHGPTLVNTWSFKVAFELNRGDADATMHAAETLADLCREHGLASYLAHAAACSGWARAQLGDEEAGVTELRRALAALTAQGNKLGVPLYQALLAEIEARVESAEGALTRVDEALALANETGERQNYGFLHRIRGEILLKRDPANTAPAEEAFLAAVAVARQQKARSLELRAALSLAKLYQSAGRAADAPAVLVQALEGFSPTAEFPEIEEAQNLLAALAETEDVKNAAASRHRRLELQTSYGRALLWSKGFAAQETKAAFARAEELAADTGNVDERFATYYGLWLGSMGRGEMGSARETAQTFLREAEAVGRMTEVAAAHRYLGLTCLTQADLIEARAHCEEALRIYDPQRERDAKFRYGTDTAASATAYLANAKWLLGDFGQARELLEEAAVRAVQSSHVPTQVNVCCFNVVFEVFRGDAQAVLRAARSLLELSREHGIPIFSSLGAMFSSWARARLGEREAGVMELQQTLTAYTEQGSRVTAPLVTALLAELEAESAGDSEAMGRIDGALSLAAETGEHWTDPMLHRIRGEILLKRDPTDTAPAEEAFLTAIAVAQQQKARSFGLRAALSLAKLYQSTGRAAGAHAVLAPALEGFSPTPELPEIAEAQALLAALPRAIRR
jgi:class 3 adenylate cyclase/predicted ATPase